MTFARENALSSIYRLNTLLHQCPRHSSKPFTGEARTTLSSLVKSTLKKPTRDHGFHVRHARRSAELLDPRPSEVYNDSGTQPGALRVAGRTSRTGRSRRCNQSLSKRLS